MVDRHEGETVGDHDTELFIKLARQCLRRRLSGLKLAAGEFPAAALMLLSRPLAEQEASLVVPDNAGYHLQTHGHVRSGTPH